MSGERLLEEVGENWCLTVVRAEAPLTRDEMTRRLGHALANPVEWDGSMEPFYDLDFNQEPLRLPYLLAAPPPAVSSATWVVVEPYGIEGSRPEVQAALSVAARTFTLLINQNAWIYAVAQAGEMLSWSDLQDEELPDTEDPFLAALAHLQKDSGVLWQEHWFAARRWLVQSQPLRVNNA